MPILIADTHIHQFRDCAGPDPETGLNSRLLDGIKVLRRAFDEAAKRDRRLIHLGDVLHLKQGAPNEARNLVRAEFKRAKAAGVESVVVLGNHDRTRDGRDAEAVGDLEEYAEVVRTAPTASFTLREMYWPWHSDLAERARALEVMKKDSAAKELAGGGRGAAWTFYGHVAVAGAVYPSGAAAQGGDEVALADLRPERFAAMFFGHVHKRQRLGGVGVDRREKSVGGDRDDVEDAGGPSSRVAGPAGSGTKALDRRVVFGRGLDLATTRPPKGSQTQAGRALRSCPAWYLGAALPTNWGEEGDAYGFAFWDPACEQLEWFDGGAPRFVVLAWPREQDAGGRLKGNFARVLCRPGREDEARAWAVGAGPRWLEVIPVLEPQAPERRVEGLTLDLAHGAMVERYAKARWTAKAPTLAAVVAVGKELLHE